MKFSERLLDMIEDHEGIRLKPYRCTAGKLTIGVGRNLEDVGISAAEAHVLLTNDIARCQKSLMTLPYYLKLDAVRQAVLIDMCFNLGFEGLTKFKKTLKAVEEGHFAEAAKEMLDSSWASQVGKRAVRLSEMMRTGVWDGLYR